MRKTLIALLACLWMISLISPPAFAAKPEDQCNSSPLDIDFVKALSVEFGNIGFSICDVTRHRGKNLGYGEMAIAQGLASISGTPLFHIMHMRTDEKMGWGKIAKELGVKVSDAVHRSSRVLDRVGLPDEATRIKIDIDLSDDDKDHGNGKKSNKEDKGKDKDKDKEDDTQNPPNSEGNKGKSGSANSSPERGSK